MTKKDFETVARIMGYMLANRSNDDMPNSKLVEFAMNEFAATNPRFNRTIFMGAVVDHKTTFDGFD